MPSKQGLLSHTLKWSCLTVNWEGSFLLWLLGQIRSQPRKGSLKLIKHKGDKKPALKEKQTRAVNTNSWGSSSIALLSTLFFSRANQVMNQPVIDVTYICPPILPLAQSCWAWCEMNIGSDVWYWDIVMKNDKSGFKVLDEWEWERKAKKGKP